MVAALCMTLLLPLTFTAEPGRTVPPELVEFSPYKHNPVFEGRGPGHWDELIRERGWILREGDTYTMWYTGYVSGDRAIMKLGMATSTDGYTWTRYSDEPIFSELWVEDMMVVKQGETYYMFAEGAGDRAHLLTSTDRVHWTEQGTLDIRHVDGSPLKPGPFGTPCAWYEDGVWYLFYERDDEAVWVATSKDMTVWTNVKDEPVIKRGPEPYDTTMIALNQIVKHEGRYYAYYHATAPQNGPDKWTMNVAVSTDLIHWEKYARNPIIGPDHSSGILVHDGTQYRMYCMHRAVSVFLPRTGAPAK